MDDPVPSGTSAAEARADKVVGAGVGEGEGASLLGLPALPERSAHRGSGDAPAAGQGGAVQEAAAAAGTPDAGAGSDGEAGAQATELSGRRRGSSEHTVKFLSDVDRRESIWTPEPSAPPRPEEPSTSGEGAAGQAAVRWRSAIDSVRSQLRSGERGSLGDRFNIYPTANANQDLMPEEEAWPDSVIHPMDPWYSTWWTVTVIASAITALTVPVDVAFYQSQSVTYRFTGNFLFISWLVLELVFLVDMMVTFRLAYMDGLQMVTSKRRIGLHYLRGAFVIDLLAVIPYEVCYTMFDTGEATRQATNGALQPASIVRTALPLLRILRTYRLFQLFTSEHYNTELPFTLSTLVRNYTVVLLWTHFSACVMFYIAVVQGFGSEEWAAATVLPGGSCAFPDGSPAEVETWLGGPCSESVGDSQFERYAVSIYWAIITMTTVGYGDYSPLGYAEIAWTVVYVLINIGLNAYVLGGITLIAVKDDANIVAYREKSRTLRDYINIHDIPAEISTSIESHLRLHFANEKASDTEVLSIFPATLRRNILRYIYKGRLQSSYLYQGCSIKFLDLLVAAASFDLFMPQLDLVKYGKLVTELMMLIEGEMTCHDMEGAAQRADDDSGGGGGGVDGGDGPRAGTMYAVREGELIGEVAFFTEEPAQETLSTITVCRVMVISRMAWIGILERHSSGAEVMLENLSRGMEEALGGSADSSAQAGGAHPAVPLLHPAFARPAATHPSGATALKAPDEPSTQAAPANVEAMEAKGSTAAGRWSSAHRSLGGAMPRKASFHEAPSSPVTSAPSVFGIYNQDQAERTGEMLGLYVQRQKDAITAQLHTAAAEGDLKSIRNLLGQGLAIDREDYTGRTAVFFAISQERTVALQTLLRAGAKVNLTARGYGTPLFFACRSAASDEVLDMLLAFHAPLGLTEAEQASELCRAVLDGDIRMLRRLMRCGVDPAAKGYDSRTALHVAAGGGFPAAVAALLEGGCPALVEDRWGVSPVEEARRAGNTAMVASLEAHASAKVSVESELLSE